MEKNTIKDRVMAASSVLLGLSSLSVHAQSSVTIYGVLDAGFVYNSNANGQHQVSLTSGNVQGDRWGFQGKEDLGGGLATVFKLESGFNIANGTSSPSGSLFGRVAWVGLSDGESTVTVGRQYDSIVDYVQQGSGALYWGSLYAVHPGDYDNIANSWRTNNSIKYRLDTHYGFSLSGLFGFGNTAENFGINRIVSVGAGYDIGGFHLGVAYTDIHDPNFSFYGNNPTSSTTASNMSFSTAISGYASAGTEKLSGATATYSWGASRIALLYTRAAFGDLGALSGIPNAYGSGATAVLSTYDVNYTYRVTPTLVTGVGYALTAGHSMNGQDGAKYHQFDVGADYNLSKRTDLYAAVVYQHATGNDSRSEPAVANIAGVGPASGDKQTLVILGMRHKF